MENVNEELKDLLKKLENSDPVDSKGNPFVLLPSKDLHELKKTIEEFAEELTPYLNDSRNNSVNS